MAIKKDDVFRACDAIFADGVAPSLVAVRTMLGSGSYSTISAFLTEWKSASRAAPVVGVDDAPEEVVEVFAVALRSMWSVAQTMAADDLKNFRAECEDRIGLLVEKEKEALDLAQSLQVEIDMFTANSMAMKSCIEEKNSALIQLMQSNAELKARDDEMRTQHRALLAKIRPISVRKEPVAKVAKKA